MSTRPLIDLSPAEILSSLQAAYLEGAQTLTIYSRRQDIGIEKCEWGAAAGYLDKEIVEIDEQETWWVYRFTEQAKREWSSEEYTQ